MPEQEPHRHSISRAGLIFLILFAIWLLLSVEGWLPTWLRLPLLG